MKEIKFRIWDKDMNRWWCEDSLSLQMDGKKIHPAPWSTLSADLPNETIVIQQYTGLKDKNGKEVYIGDIVKWGKADAGRELVEVHWSEEGHDGHPCIIYSDSYSQGCGFEVVGNIFEK